MKVPDRIDMAVQRFGADHAKGKITIAAATAKLREAVEQDEAYARAVLDGHARQLLAAYRRAHPAVGDPRQASLFPDLPAELHISPGVAGNWLDFTRRDWEMARNMLYARTSNQVSGATAAAALERAEFDRAYQRVVPRLVTRTATTADVIGDLTEEAGTYGEARAALEAI